LKDENKQTTKHTNNFSREDSVSFTKFLVCAMYVFLSIAALHFAIWLFWSLTCKSDTKQKKKVEYGVKRMIRCYFNDNWAPWLRVVWGWKIVRLLVGLIVKISKPVFGLIIKIFQKREKKPKKVKEIKQKTVPANKSAPQDPPPPRQEINFDPIAEFLREKLGQVETMENIAHRTAVADQMRVMSIQGMVEDVEGNEKIRLFVEKMQGTATFLLEAQKTIVTVTEQLPETMDRLQKAFRLVHEAETNVFLADAENKNRLGALYLKNRERFGKRLLVDASGKN
jgi:hypothetical protein